MRYALMLLAFAAPVLGGCVSDGEQVLPRSATTFMTPDNTGTFMAADRSTGIMIMPGDTTSQVQLRYLTAANGR